MLEYPLWYAYFLLPTAFCVRPVAWRDRWRAKPPQRRARAPASPRRTRLAALLLVLGGTFALYDYMRVVVIFAPPADAGPLEQRIADGQQERPLRATTPTMPTANCRRAPGQVMSAFTRARTTCSMPALLMAWARALAERGESDRVTLRRAAPAGIPQRRRPDEFFAPCAAPGSAAAFPCLGSVGGRRQRASRRSSASAPARPLRFEDFR